VLINFVGVSQQSDGTPEGSDEIVLLALANNSID